MSENTSDTISAVIEKYQSSCQFFVKIDIGFLAAITTALTILGLSTEYEIYGFLKEISPAIYASLILLILGLGFDYWLVVMWAKVKLNLTEETLLFGKINRLGYLQLIFHILFIIAVGSYIIGHSVGYVTNYQSGKAVAIIQVRIEQFYATEDRFPTSLDELVDKYPSTKLDINTIGSQNLSYKLDNQRGYILQYAWQDKQIGTSDDMIYDHFDFLNWSK